MDVKPHPDQNGCAGSLVVDIYQNLNIVAFVVGEKAYLELNLHVDALEIMLSKGNPLLITCYYSEK